MEENGASSGRVLLITASGMEYALPVSEVERVSALRAGDVSPVPFDDSGRIRGIYNDRGAVTVLLRCEGWQAAADGREEMTVVILRDGEHRFAVAVDAASAVADAVPGAHIRCLSARALYEGDAHDHHQ